MAEALALLGGGAGDVGATWMARLSREERVLEPACVRLKEAVEKACTRYQN